MKLTENYPKSMKRNTLILIVLMAIVSPLFAQKITTLAPKINEQSQKYIEIKKIALTDKYTIVYFFIDNRPRTMQDLMEGRGSASHIKIDPKIKLINVKDDDHVFKFIKAEGIVVEPQEQTLEAGDIVEFTVYFERLKPGVELFDIYEGKDFRNKTDNRHFWNFYGVHIRNPKSVTKTPTTKPVKPTVVPKTDSIKTPIADTILVVKSTLADKKLTVGEAVRLNNIYFEIGKFNLLPASFTELDQLVTLMNTTPKMTIRIEGHTDKVGDFDENLKLSLSRANAVKSYLVGKGIDFGRIEAKGYGSTRPATKSTAEAERRKNRRVEFVVIKI